MNLADWSIQSKLSSVGIHVTHITLKEETLWDLVGDLDLEELQTQLREFLAQGDAEADDKDDVVDALLRLSDAERKVFHLVADPIWLALGQGECDWTLVAPVHGQLTGHVDL